ncbi:hypothetical protein GGU11DRAFT_759186 [Lentinula aff. detonsa]|nr:hypothetical protein GGU11DRAFT_759186 [Lentinula aff. detonsa]
MSITLLAVAKEYLIPEYSGYRVGFFGLAGSDEDSDMLKEQQDAVIVVAAVTEGCPLVDFIPGDHDHDVVVQGDKITIINTDHCTGLPVTRAAVGKVDSLGIVNVIPSGVLTMRDVVGLRISRMSIMAKRTLAPSSSVSESSVSEDLIIAAMVNFIADGFDGYTRFIEIGVETLLSACRSRKER